MPLGRDIIHSVANPLQKVTGAIHVYEGDFIAMERSEWEPLMQTVRDAAMRLVAEEKIVITQAGKPIDGRTAKGPIRLRLR